MNYEEFEKTILADPSAESEALDAFEATSPEARELRRKVRLLDQQLASAMAVPVPPSVVHADPTGQSNVVGLKQSRRRAPAVWFATAACLALVALVFTRQPEVAPATETVTLADTLVELIVHDIHEMEPGRPAVDRSKLTAVLGPAGSEMDDGAPLVSFAKTCPVNGNQVAHLVMQGENGPVTVIVMPDERVDGPVSIMRDGLEGVILPVGDSGSIAIIGRDSASVEAIQDQALEAVGLSI
ncbi:MAG: DUF3379 family protein [Pseudomonadota bacterium]